jgi:hypothetical protein
MNTRKNSEKQKDVQKKEQIKKQKNKEIMSKKNKKEKRALKQLFAPCVGSWAGRKEKLKVACQCNDIS